MPEMFNISKSEFANYIEAIKRDVIFERQFNALFRENGGVAELYLESPHSLINMLEIFFKDNEGIIRMWCFDYDFGRLCCPEYASDDGEYSNMPETAEGLYDYLTE